VRADEEEIISMSKPWKSEGELFELAKKELFTAVVGDTLDKMGLYHQFLPPEIQPISKEMIVIGRAMTVLEADYFVDVMEGTQNAITAKPFGLLFEAIDGLKPGEVYVCGGASPRYALWGGLCSMRAAHLKAAGVVLDGYYRDTLEIRRLQFPCFGHGSYAQDQAGRGKVVDFRIPIEIAGIRIHPGDIVFGDVDGVLIIPQEAVEEAFTRAFEKARGEQRVAEAIKRGMGAVEAWNKFGIM
jgi:regulator of RNase E activity RraA